MQFLVILYEILTLSIWLVESEPGAQLGCRGNHWGDSSPSLTSLGKVPKGVFGSWKEKGGEERRGEGL